MERINFTSSDSLQLAHAHMPMRTNNFPAEIQKLPAPELKQVVSITPRTVELPKINIKTPKKNVTKPKKVTKPIQPAIAKAVIVAKPSAINTVYASSPKLENSKLIFNPLTANIQQDTVSNQTNKEADKKDVKPNRVLSFLKKTFLGGNEKLPMLSFGTLVTLFARSPKTKAIAATLLLCGFDMRVGVAYQNANFFSDKNEPEKKRSWSDVRGEFEIRLPSFIVGGLAWLNLNLMEIFAEKPKPATNQNPEFVMYKTVDFLTKAALGTAIASYPLQKLALLNPHNTNFKFSATKIKFSNSLTNIWNSMTGNKGDGVNRFQVGLSVDTDMFRTKLGRTTATNGVEIRFDKANPVAAYYTGVKHYIQFSKRMPEAEINTKMKLLHQEIIGAPYTTPTSTPIVSQ